MAKPRLQKFIRGDEIDPLKLTSRDMGLIRDVYEYRFLNSEQLVALHEGSERGILNRLSLLYRHGYLDRPEIQKTKHLSSSHIVYSLERKGAVELSRSADEREGMYRRIREVKHTSALVAHALMISQFRICLTLAVKQRPDVKLTRWAQGNDLVTLLQRRGENPSLKPDAFFVLETSEFKYPCFLEADRATESEGRFLSKLQAYWRHNRERRFEDSLGVSHFRVLTTTPTEKRAEKLCLVAKDADDDRKGSPMYLFLSETRFSLSKPEAILSPIWASPVGEGRGILE